jgi:SEC-C motif-containing protein
LRFAETILRRGPAVRSLPSARIGGPSVRRNADCPCASGKKFKQCCRALVGHDRLVAMADCPKPDSSKPHPTRPTPKPDTGPRNPRQGGL